MRLASLCVFLASLISGCLTNPAHPIGGILFHDLKGPNQAVPGATAGTKKGEACAHAIFGYVTIGEASIDEARKAGGLKAVSHVDYSSFSVLGFVYTKTCALVRGA